MGSGVHQAWNRKTTDAHVPKWDSLICRGAARVPMWRVLNGHAQNERTEPLLFERTFRCKQGPLTIIAAAGCRKGHEHLDEDACSHLYGCHFPGSIANGSSSKSGCKLRRAHNKFARRHSESASTRTISAEGYVS